MLAACTAALPVAAVATALPALTAAANSLELQCHLRLLGLMMAGAARAAVEEKPD